jgi:hypothetical protein
VTKKNNIWREMFVVGVQFLGAYLLGNLLFMALNIEETFSFIAAAFVCLIYALWEALND